MKAATKPTNNAGANSPKLTVVLEPAIFKISYALAPPITGIAKKKENSVATALGKPKSIPPIMVAPDLDVPGIKAAHCAIPTLNASTIVS